MKLHYFVVLVAAILVIALLGDKGKSSQFDKDLQAKYQNVINKIPSRLTTNSYQKGKVNFLTDNKELSEERLQQGVAHFAKSNQQKKAHMLVWFDSLKNTATASAMGMDWKHHFVNSYLVGIHPFPVKNKWLPLYTLAQMKTYQLDSDQYQADDLWQNSAQAFMLPRGDCEDHAIILTDWLISEGIDARVVVGTYKTDGHAWVVATINNQEFLLEPTAKRVRKSWSHFPLASLAKDYYPSFMFNRESFWVNLNKSQTYRGKDWLKTSVFTKENNF